MPKYTVIIANIVNNQLLRHTEYLAQFSLPAAKKFVIEFEKMISRLEDNPYQFPVDLTVNIPKKEYRKALFYKRYKGLFFTKRRDVFLDAVVDGRQDPETYFS